MYVCIYQASDFAGLNERLRKVANWSTEDTEYINMVDNNRVFFECLLEQVLAQGCNLFTSHLPPTGVG